MSCIQTVSPVLKKGMEHASTSDVAWSASVTDPNLVKESARLHYMLTQLMAGAPLDIVLNTAWRRLASGDEDGRMHHGNLALPHHRRDVVLGAVRQADPRAREEDWQRSQWRREARRRHVQHD